MATQRILTRNGGTIVETVPITASAGVSSAGAVIAMNASGVLDPTMTPAYTGDVTKASGSVVTTVTAINGGVNLWIGNRPSEEHHGDG